MIEIDENTRYGRSVTPILKNHEDNSIVRLHKYVVVHRTITENAVHFSWETIAKDDLYPFQPSDTALMSDEVGW